jgi:hypothetical protein
MIRLGITHVISWTKTRNKDLSDKIFYLNILEPNESKKSVFNYIFKTMDFLRHCMIYRGSIVFIDDSQFPNLHFKQNYLIRNLLIVIFSIMLQMSAYDTWTYINSKLLFFWIPPEDLANVSIWVNTQSSIINYVFANPVVRCLCGACVIILKRSVYNNSFGNTKKCSCSNKSKNAEYSECPSNGCYEYIQEIKV